MKSRIVTKNGKYEIGENGEITNLEPKLSPLTQTMLEQLTMIDELNEAIDLAEDAINIFGDDENIIDGDVVENAEDCEREDGDTNSTESVGDNSTICD